MRRYTKFLCGCALLLCGLPNVMAMRVTDLYSAVQEVKDYDQSSLQQAVQAGLEAVLIKVSGNADINSVDQVREASSTPRSLVKKYAYLKTDDAHPQLRVVLTYDQVGVNRLLQQAAQARWSSQRPATLIWLAIEDAKGDVKVVASADAESSILRTVAKSRGVPIFLPMLDLNESQQVGPTQIQSAEVTLLQGLAKRYAADAVLIGWVSQRDGAAEGRWLFANAENQWQWTAQGEAIPEILRGAVDHIANTMAAQYAILQDKSLEEAVRLRVNHVSALPEYAHLLTLLRGLASVRHVDVLHIEKGAVVLNLLVQEGVTGLAQALRGSHQLKVDALATEAGQDAEMVYRWTES